MTYVCLNSYNRKGLLSPVKVELTLREIIVIRNSGQKQTIIVSMCSKENQQTI